MSNVERKIAFKVEFSWILELLADQIYQSPLALLRENTQNAFDAIRMRIASDTTSRLRSPSPSIKIRLLYRTTALA